MSDTILITGANRGIGLELARAFAEQDWHVLACCRSPEKANDLKKLAGNHEKLVIYALDVDDVIAIERLAQGLEGQAIDILFNNAGVFGPQEQDFGDIDPEAWLDVMRTNVVGPMKMAEAFVEHVAASRRKIIASMGSMMGSIGDNTSGGYYVYRTSKAAVHMVMKSLSVDLKERGMTSVVFHPGWVKTEMGGAQAPLEPAESAAGLYEVLVKLEEADNGRLLTYEGEELPW